MTATVNNPGQDQTILCLHHNDNDGRAAAAIVRKAIGQNVWLYEMDYGGSIPLERIVISDKIIIVDFSLPKEEMQQLADYHDILWIDHHKSSIDDMKGIADNWPGIRDNNEAACVLTWNYFFPEKPVPRAITLIGDRDIWRWAEEDTGGFTEGLYQNDTRPLNDKLWIPLLDNDLDYVAEIISVGNVLREARMRDIRRTLTQRGFAVTLEGYRTLVVNVRGSGDIGQKVRDMGYEIAYCYADIFSQGEITTFVSLYSDELDVSAIAERFGGGGHAGAAGFHFKRGPSPFPDDLQIEFLHND